jgi:hypothetical protein
MNPTPDALATLIGGGCLIISLTITAILLIPGIFYCLTMQKSLTLAGPEHRAMEPGLVWLLFIPFFNLVWQFFVVKNVAQSVRSWGQAHGKEVGDGGWSIGLTACILSVCSFIPFLGFLCGIGGLVCLILWWVKVAGFNTLMRTQG